MNPSKKSIANINTAAYLEASINYSIIVWANGDTVMTSKTLKRHEKSLINSGWCRIHKSYIVNPLFFGQFEEDHSGIYLQNGKMLPVSRRKKNEVLKWRNGFLVGAKLKY